MGELKWDPDAFVSREFFIIINQINYLIAKAIGIQSLTGEITEDNKPTQTKKDSD